MIIQWLFEVFSNKQCLLQITELNTRSHKRILLFWLFDNDTELILIIKRFLKKKTRKIFDKGFHEWHRSKNKSRLQLTLSPTTIEKDVIDSVTQLVGWHKPKLNNLTFCRRKKTWLENLTDIFFSFSTVSVVFYRFFCYRNGAQLLDVQDSTEIEHKTTLPRYLQVVSFLDLIRVRDLRWWGYKTTVQLRKESNPYSEFRRFWN